MSGGIDSSVCLYLLKQQGLDVKGLTLRLDDEYEGPIKKAKMLCDKFGLEHIVLDYREIFKEKIIKTFNQQVLSGITPVPCVACNRFIKLGLLVEFCQAHDAKLATGHYAVIRECNNANGHERCIFKAKDVLKDQTHFLCSVKKEYLQDIVFPLGDMFKSEVFRIARDNNLVDIAGYKESQEVCFFNNRTYAEYVKSLNISEKRCEIRHVRTGEKLGECRGLLKYTIGQRQGIGVAWSEPLYVVKKDFQNNVLFVGEENCLYSNVFKVQKINIIANDYINKEQFECEVCLRDKTPMVSAVVYRQSNGEAQVKLKGKARAITSGQICAFYDDNMLLGGGEIVV